ncbi:B12-binding domain-containing radical SAM protein [Chlamydiota bacterium]
MKILLVMPDAGIHKLKIGPFRMSFREAPLTLTTLAALVPAELNADITITDESIDDIPFKKHFDLVGISCLTGTALRAYEIADRFRKLGSKVVLGGIHVTLRTEEAKEHADTIIIGFAEKTWPTFLIDFFNGVAKQVYKEDSIDLRNLPFPKRELQKKWGYMVPNTVFATRGCKRSCEFCTVPAVPFGWHTRPVNEVIDEIKSIPAKRIVFNDVSMVEDKDYAKELFSAMIPLKKKWGGLATSSIVYDHELLDLMTRSGCVYLLIGFETVTQHGLAGINKRFNDVDKYIDVINQLHKRNIVIQGCFILGLDHDDTSIFKKTVEMVNNLRIDIPRFAIYTPYPQTKAFRILKEQGRILHEYWPHYDTQHVVFKPVKMSPRELDDGFKWTYEQTFKVSSTLQRLRISKHFPVTFLGNLAYRMYIGRLQNDLNRIYYKKDCVN